MYSSFINVHFASINLLICGVYLKACISSIIKMRFIIVYNNMYNDLYCIKFYFNCKNVKYQMFSMPCMSKVTFTVDEIHCVTVFILFRTAVLYC